jgi:glycosyltransferase involved in cell wall biosynthesis
MKTAALFVYVWPEPRSSAAGVRTHELARLLREQGYSVHGFSPCTENEAMREWQDLGVVCHHQPANESSIEEKLKTISPEIVIYDRFVMEEQFGWRLRTAWPNATHVIDTQDLHCLRRAREKANKRGEAGAPRNEDFGEDLVRELASLHRADACFVVSSFEHQWLLGQQYDANRVFTLPFSAPLEAHIPSFEERAGFCFLGNFRHAPNLDGVLWMVKEIWPLIRARIPKAELHLYGAYPPAQISCLDGKMGVRAGGPVRDHRAALRSHRLLLAPLRFGAGIKGKVLESWASGTPVVGTPMAFEGISKTEAQAAAADFAERAVALYENQAAWKEAQAHGLSTVEENFSAEAVRAALQNFLGVIPERRTQWRASLTGRMLRLQVNNASKYFSMWIEAKNKK